MQSDSFESGPPLHIRLAAIVAILLGIGLFIPANAEEPDSTHVGFSLTGRGPSMADELSTVMPSLELNNASVMEAMRHLATVSRQIDPDQTGMTFTVDADAIETAKPITLSLHNISMYDALRNICKLGHVKARLMGSSLHIVSLRESLDAVEEPSIDQGNSHHLIVDRLQTIVIDKINLKNMDVAKILQYLAQRSRALDPDKAGVNFVLGNIVSTDNVQRQVTLTTTNIALADLLVMVSQQTNLRYFVEDGAVYFKP